MSSTNASFNTNGQCNTINESLHDARTTLTNGVDSTEALGPADYFMAVAVLTRERSIYEEFKVGACIVNKDNKIVGTGYNDLPALRADKQPPWEDTSSNDDGFNNKAHYVCHAELNAVMNKTSTDLIDCTIYVTLFPCNECAKVIIRAGIRQVVYLSLPEDKAKKLKYQTSHRLLEAAGVTVIKFKNERRHPVVLLDLQDT